MRAIGLLAVALVLVPAAAGAVVGVTTELQVAASPFVNGVTGSASGTPVASTLTVRVHNTGTEAIRRVDFNLPSTAYAPTGGSGPDGTWSVITSNAARVRFQTACASAGLAAGATATFVLQLTVTATPGGVDGNTSPFTVNVRTVGAGGAGCPATNSGSTTFTAPGKVLLLTGGVATPTRLLGPGVGGQITWTVTNESTASQSNLTVAPVVITPSTATGSCSTVAGPIASGGPATVTCNYTFNAANTYSFAANAKNGAGTATAVGAKASGTIQVGSANVTWTKAVIVSGRPAYTLQFRVNNASATTVSRVDLTGAGTGWALQTGSATNGLTYSGSSSAADVAFTGTLAANQSSDVTVTFSAVPTVASTTTYPFLVKLTPAEGSTYALSIPQLVAVDLAVADVTGLTADATSSGQTLAWVNEGTTHDGVVIFRTPTGTVPPVPADLTLYTAGSNQVVLSDPPGSSTASWTDTTVGNFNYRVCARDAYYVYSKCSSGFFNHAGWVDAEQAPASGWVHTVGGNALVRGGLMPGSRIAQANNSPSVAILNSSTGARDFAPTPIPALPSMYTPAAPEGSTTLLFAADQNGTVTAIDLNTGGRPWQTPIAGETFMAGVSGITRANASAAFKAAYPNDILLLGSTTGTVFALDATTGARLWSVSAGSPVYGFILYDAGTDLFWVPTSAAGVKAFSLAGSSPAIAATPAVGWNFADPSGNYQVNCVSQVGYPGLACVNNSGELRIVNRTTGALLAPMFPTGVTSPGPAALVRVSGTAAPAGLVVASATRINVLTATATATPVIASAATWVPSGFRISTPAVYASSGYLVVGGTDRRLHRVSLTTGADQAQSQQITTQAPGGVQLAQPMFDSSSNRYFFGTDDGHVWAVPTF